MVDNFICFLTQISSFNITALSYSANGKMLPIRFPECGWPITATASRSKQMTRRAQQDKAHQPPQRTQYSTAMLKRSPTSNFWGQQLQNTYRGFFVQSDSQLNRSTASSTGRRNTRVTYTKCSPNRFQDPSYRRYQSFRFLGQQWALNDIFCLSAHALYLFCSR